MHPHPVALIKLLQPLPPPEGGLYRDIFRSSGAVHRTEARTARRALTMIHFLLPEGTHGRWHRGAGLDLMI
jgi:predicted cupin superfamily sugar epimerase